MAECSTWRITLDSFVRLIRKTKAKDKDKPRRRLLQDNSLIVEEIVDEYVPKTLQEEMGINRDTSLSKLRNDSTSMMNITRILKDNRR